MDTSAISKTNFYFKLKAGESYTLADVPELIALRWPYFRDNWEKLKQGYIETLTETFDRNTALEQTHKLSNFIKFVSKGTGQNPFRNSSILSDFYSIFAVTPVGAIPLSKQEQAIVSEKEKAVSRYTRDDIRILRSDLTAIRDGLADTVGMGDETYNRIAGRSSTPKRVDPTIDSVITMSAVQSLIMALDFVLANEYKERANAIDPFALARANASNPEIDIRSYKAGKLVKMEHGDTLQDVALKHLGDSKKWIEIAITNGLKPPYIDEDGTELPLLSNGSGNKINLASVSPSGAKTKEHLFINQIVLLSSDIYRQPETRTIKNIMVVPVSNELILELDGDPDLGRYRITDRASIRVFKPNTVNSNFFLVLPTSGANLVDNKEAPWFLNGLSTGEQQAGIDLQLSETGDLVIGSSGDLQLSYGLENAVQSLKIKFLTERGENPFHPTLGIPTVKGRTNLDFPTLKNQLTEAVRAQVTSDPRFGGLTSLSVSQLPVESNSARGVAVSLTVRLKGTNTEIPINFSVTY